MPAGKTDSATKKIHSVCKDSDSIDAEYVLSVKLKDNKGSTDKEIYAAMILNGVEVNFQVDW